MMKRSLILLSFIMCLGLVILPSCGKKASSTNPNAVITTATIEVTPVPNHTVKSVELGIADSFAIMAFTSITSAPTSNITGKVGLKPGTRSLINLNPATEVVGGLDEIYAGDDVGDPSDYMNMAREDLIGAYREIVSRPADKDKVEAYRGNPSGKILPPGIYRWSNGVTINSDVTLEGSSSDVFIFQITGDMSIAAKVRIVLSGGARAKNIYWQVSGKVDLGPTSVVQGTVMSQLTLEMKSLAQLNGRALVKNGKVLLSQNVITKPGF